jgi:hypothetical protein
MDNTTATTTTTTPVVTTKYTVRRPLEAFRPGQRVRATSYGGNIRLWMTGAEGTVTRITRSGNPIILLDHEVRTNHRGETVYSTRGHLLKSLPEVSDTYGCFKVIDAEGKLVWIETEVDG